MIRAALAAALMVLAGCGTSVMAPDAEVARRAYASDGPSSLTLYTVINNRNEDGAHTALLIDGSQRVLWDPAGSFYHPAAPEQNDLLYGFTPTIQLVYEDYHARETFRIVKQTVPVSRAVADKAMRLAAQAGPAWPATCSIKTTGILRQLPGFGSIPSAWYPKRTMRAFADLPGVATRTVTDDDADDNHGVLIRVTRPAGPTVVPGG